MNEDEIIHHAAIAAGKIEEILLKYFNKMNNEDALVFGVMTLSLVVSNFIDAIIDDNYQDRKYSLTEDIIHRVKTHLKNNDIIKESEKQKH